MNINVTLDEKQIYTMRRLLTNNLYDIVSSGNVIRLIAPSLVDGEIRLARNKAELNSTAAILKQIDPGFDLQLFIEQLANKRNFAIGIYPKNKNGKEISP